MDRAKSRLSFIGVLIAALLVAFLGMLALVGGGTAVESAQADPLPHVHDDVTFNPWSSATSLPDTAGNWYLTEDVKLSSTWSVPSGTTNLCLNGHGIKMTGNNSVVTINAGATLKLYDCDTTTVHKYSVSDAKSNGAGFATVNDALTSGYRTFIGGYITGGKGTPVSSWSRGGALYIEGAVEMYGGTIIGNGQYGVTHGGGFNTQGSGTFKMYGGSIQNNAGGCGGATRLQGSGSCEIYGGKIINNIVGADGGGIHVGGSISLILKDCEISGNYAGNGPGAGIWMTTTGTEVSGKTVIENNLTNSSESNVEIGNGYVISVGELTDGATIGIKLQSGTGAFTSGWSTYMSDKDPADYFTSDNATYSAFLSAGEAQIGIPPHEHDNVTFQPWDTANALPTSEGNYYLVVDVTLGSTWDVPAGTTKLCLNGHGITKTGSGSVISVNSAQKTLVLYDCGDRVHYFDVYDKESRACNINETPGDGRKSFTGGYITGGNSLFGGGISVTYGKFEMYGGTIIGNRAYNSGNRGGGVYIESGACVTMYGGAVCYNYAQNTGAGFYVNHGTFTLLGGVISHNKTDWAGGGGVSVQNNNTTPLTVFNLFGGVIENNDTKNNYGAIDVSTGANVQFNVKGNAVVRNNYSGTTDNIHNVNLRSDYSTPPLINIVGEPDGAYIGVAIQSTTGTFTSGWSTYMEGKDPADYFVSDNAAYGIGLVNGEAAALLLMSATEEGYEGTYDGAAHGITVTPSVTGATIKYGATADACTLDALSYTEVGVHTVYYVAAMSGYASAKGSATVTITKKTVTVTADAKEKTYGDVDLALTASVTGLVDGDSPDYSLERAEGENVGDYAITVTLGNNPNYDVIATNGTFTINKKSVTVIADPKSKTYGDVDLALTASVTGLVDGDSPDYSLERAEGENVGDYAITVTLGNNPNYDVIATNGTFTINKRSLTVTADAKEKAYGDVDPALTYTAVGLVGTDGFTGTLVRDAGEKVGSYDIALGTLSAGDNYEIAFTGACLTITQKAVSKVEVKAEEGEEEIAVTVDGLDKEAQAIKEQDPTAGEISVVMTVEHVSEEKIAEEPEEESHAKIIKNTAQEKNFEFYEIKVEKTVDSVKTILEETSTVFEIAIPYAKAHKRGLTVYSYHGNQVVTFVESDSKEAGTFRADKDNKIIYVYTKTFSTYAIGYAPYYRVATSLNLGTYKGKATVKLSSISDDKVFTQADADPAHIVFTEVPKGQYVLTVTWTDGAENTISMKVSVGPADPISLPEPKEQAEEPQAAAAEADVPFEDPFEDPFEETAEDLEDVVFEDKRNGEAPALPKKNNDLDAA